MLRLPSVSRSTGPRAPGQLRFAGLCLATLTAASVKSRSTWARRPRAIAQTCTGVLLGPTLDMRPELNRPNTRPSTATDRRGRMLTKTYLGQNEDGTPHFHYESDGHVVITGPVYGKMTTS